MLPFPQSGAPAARTACGLPGCLWLPAGVAEFEERSPVPYTASLGCVTKGISFVNLTRILFYSDKWSLSGPGRETIALVSMCQHVKSLFLNLSTLGVTASEQKAGP